MCFLLYLASSLTLSEVRSMLPAGLTADALAPDDARRLRAQFRPAITVARLLIGPCTCDLVLHRNTVTHAEEAELRVRYAGAELSRPRMIRALDAHRAGVAAEAVQSPAHWRTALADFVGEHERNAGPSTYWLHFVTDLAATPPIPLPVRAISLSAVRHDGRWLVEDEPVRVMR